MGAFINQYFPFKRFEDLPIPFAAVACDLETGEEVVLRDAGDLALAIRASCAIPGVFVPIETEGRKLIDGGIVAPVPTKAVKKLGAEIIIAVDVISSGATYWGTPSTLLGVFFQSAIMLLRTAAKHQHYRADIVIIPNIAHLRPDAKVVLVKLARTGRITEQNIQDGLEWVLENRAKFGIKIVNISAGGDFEQSYLHDSLSQTVEECVARGICVVCAVGNAGHLPTHPVFPPASSPSAISVGGLDDKNSINRAKRGMYRSSYGPTLDGFQKPEMVAPSIWVPAPILPNTPTAQQAALLEVLDKTEDADLHRIIGMNPNIEPDLDVALDRPAYIIRQIIALKLRSENVITRHYKYVDGTSFAAPIVSSVAAQMLEANPYLTPQQIKRILISTAERLPHYEVDRQGWGVIDPCRAVELAVSFI
jgi:serine protease AprX